MDKKKIYSLLMFILVAVVLANSVALLSANRINNGKSIKSILKSANFEKYIGAVSQNDDENVDNNNSYDGDGVDSDDNADDIDATMSVQQGRSGVLIECSSRRVLLDENMNQRCFPASTTKVLTSLVVLNNLPLNRVITIPKAAEGVEGSSIYLRAGQKITVEDLLFGLMLRSGNDAAVALAIETAGSIENFAILMNETAKMLGAKDSNFVNPHGLHDDNHYTTAYDLALITASAYENEDFRRIVSSTKAKITIDSQATYIANKNKLLTLYDGANGVKTGYTKRSGRCLVGGAERDGMQLVTVVLNYNDMWNDTIRLLNYGFENYEMKPLDNALLGYKKELIPIEIVRPQGVTEDWKDIRYPLRRDGSEYLIIKSA